MKNIIGTLLVGITLLAGNAFAHCDQHGDTKPAAHLKFKNDIHAHVVWEQGPVEGKESILRLEFKDAKIHKATEIKAVPQVVLWMPSMGHGSSPTAIQRVTDDKGKVVTGSYRVNNVYFVMGGDWDVRVVLKHKDGTEETQSFSLNIEGDHTGHH